MSEDSEPTAGGKHADVRPTARPGPGSVHHAPRPTVGRPRPRVPAGMDYHESQGLAARWRTDLGTAGQVLRYGPPGREFDFGPFAVTRLKVTPIYDTAGRTVLYSTVALSVKAHMAGSPTDAKALAARAILTKPGQPLVFSGQGFGGLSVNVTPNGPADVAWGPKPRELAFEPLGGGNGCKLVWSVEVAVPECDDAAYQFSAMEFGYRLEFEQIKGYTVRHMVGHLRIPAVRAGADGRSLGDSPDYYLDQIIPPLMPGFARTFGTRTIDESKTRLDFSVEDREMGQNVPPAFCVDVKARAGVSSSADGLQMWTGRVTATYELTKSAPNGYLPAAHFLGTLAKSRIDAAIRHAGRANKDSVRKVAFEMEEPDIYGPRVATFSLSYTFITDLATLVQASGLWTPVPGSDWRAWATSLAGTALHPMGEARIGFVPTDDRVVDLCRPGTGTVPAASAAGPTVNAMLADLFPKPQPSNSWLSWFCSTRIEVDSGVAVLRTLPAGDPIPGSTSPPPPPADPLGPTTDLFGSRADLAGASFDALNPKLNGSGGGTFTPPPPPPPVNPLPPILIPPGGGNTLTTVPPPPPQGGLAAVRRVRPAVWLYLEGRAARAGLPVDAPRLLKVGDLTPVPANRPDMGEGFIQAPGFGTGDVPVFHAVWRLRYALPDVPDGPLPVPPNPLLYPDLTR